MADEKTISDGSVSVKALYVYQPGGGSAVTVADGSDVAQGTTTDTAYASANGSAAGTVISILKGIYVRLAGTLSVAITGPTTGTPTQVAANVAAQTILAANISRKGAGIYYDGAAILYLILSSTTPTASIYTIKMGSGLATYYEPPANYTGIIRGIWSAAVGSADVTELT